MTGGLESRRSFIRLAVAAAPGVLVGACIDDPVSPRGSTTIELGSDTGALNFIYALLQLEADFFFRASNFRFPGMTAVEAAVIRDVQRHSSAQRNFLSRYIEQGRVEDLLEFDFSTISFAQRADVIPTAGVIADAVAGAYASILPTIRQAEMLTIAGKMASVAARHSAALRDVQDLVAGTPDRTRFAGELVDAQGREMPLPPAQAFDLLRPYFKTDLELRIA
jgi:hypothetical protein